MSGIFISYRREDSAGHSGRLFDRLRERFGKDHVFMDVSAIEPGVDFVEAIDHAVGSCDALIVVIGRKWLTCTDAAGNRRLDDPKDFIRLETAAALRREIRVIPVLIQDAAMPTEKDLPEDLLKLARRQAIEISDGHWDSDTEALIETLVKVLPSEAKPSPAKITPEPSSITPAPKKNRLAWLISTITALVVALGGLLSTIDSVKNTFSGLFSSQQEKRIETTVSPPPPTSAPQVTVVVPDLIGISRDDAVAQLRHERLQAGSVTSRPADRSPGTVVEQEPAAGARLAPGSQVHLVIAEPPAEPRKMPGPKPVAVPHLIGLSQENARAALKKAGLVMGKIMQVESREAKPGTVIEQEPPAGQRLLKGNAVTLVVAIEPPAPMLVTVPKLGGLTVEMAHETLAREELIPGAVHQKASSRSRPGTVIDQKPRAGQQVKKGTAVELLEAVAVAPADATLVTVPKLGGLTVAMARESLAREGLTAGKVRKTVSDLHRPGTVIVSKPGAGQQVKKGTAVELVMAVAPGEVTILTVPKLGGLTVAMAREALAGAGLKAGMLHKKVSDRARPGTVIDQKPGAGELVEKGTAVELVVATASAETGPVATHATSKVTVIAQGEPTTRKFWESVKKPDYSKRMAYLYSGILKESASGAIEQTINSYSEREVRVLEKMLRDPRRLCESTGSDIIFAARAQETFASSDVESAYWPELRQTAIDCKSGEQYVQRNTLSPERTDKFPFEKAMTEAMQKFAREYRHLLK